MSDRKFIHKISLVVLGLLLMTSAAMAQDATPSQRAEFNKLANERRQALVKLTSLDHQAAAKIKKDEKPVAIFAQQTALQDKLDLLEQRLEILSIRYNLPMPVTSKADASTIDQRTARGINKAFERGRTRAMKQLREDCLQMLETLDFGSFLKSEG
ncbi:MAG: hypothetical protein JKX85_01230 [Phycisphaeraceae bacterium]|nr:hypothetical protein [Phycisphaeraceae bacterium]